MAFRGNDTTDLQERFEGTCPNARNAPLNQRRYEATGRRLFFLLREMDKHQPFLFFHA